MRKTPDRRDKKYQSMPYRHLWYFFKLFILVIILKIAKYHPVRYDRQVG